MFEVFKLIFSDKSNLRVENIRRDMSLLKFIGVIKKESITTSKENALDQDKRDVRISEMGKKLLSCQTK